MRNWNMLDLELDEEKNHRFESTYEELKRLFLPLCSFFSLLFWVYLWGIETSLAATCSYIFKKFWVYLWGIETKIFSIFQ